MTGQDGSFMAKLLLKKNYIVHGLIRKSATGNLKNISEIIKNKNFLKFIMEICSILYQLQILFQK